MQKCCAGKQSNLVKSSTDKSKNVQNNETKQYAICGKTPWLGIGSVQVSQRK